MDSAKAQNIFGCPAPPKRASSNGVSKEALNYKALNETLLRKIQQMKKQLYDAEKGMEKLRDENMELRQTNQKLISCTEEEKIELIVTQRVQKKLSHFTAIGQRTIQFLQNAGADMTEAIKDIQEQVDAPPPTKRVRKKLSVEPNLNKVEESPLRLQVAASTSSLTELIEIEDSADEETTPKKENIPTNQKSKGRRSALLDFNLHEAETPKVPQTTGKRQPLFIKPETPKAKKVDKKNFQTPTVEMNTEASCSTARPVRSARPKSLKEPSLGSKMRNPGKFDEPCPFISTTY